MVAATSLDNRRKDECEVQGRAEVEMKVEVRVGIEIGVKIEKGDCEAVRLVNDYFRGKKKFMQVA